MQKDLTAKERKRMTDLFPWAKQKTKDCGLFGSTKQCQTRRNSKKKSKNKMFSFQPNFEREMDPQHLKTSWGICSKILFLYGNSPQVKVNFTLQSCIVTPTNIDFKFRLDTVYATKAVSKQTSLFLAKQIANPDMLRALYSNTVATGNSGEISASLKLDFSAIPKNNEPIITQLFTHVTSECMQF